MSRPRLRPFCHYSAPLIWQSLGMLIGGLTLIMLLLWRDDALSAEFMFYDPPKDAYIPGESIRLMREGALLGTQMRAQDCADHTEELKECTTNICRIRIQVTSLRECRQKQAKSREEDMGSSPPEITEGPVGTGPGPEISPGQTSDDRTSCYQRAETLFRENFALTLTGVGSSNPELLEAVESEIERLHWKDDQRYMAVCEGYEARGLGIYEGGLGRSYRVVRLLSSLDAESRSNYIGLLRRGYSDVYAGVPRRVFYRDLVGLVEVLIFLRGLSFSEALTESIEIKIVTIPTPPTTDVIWAEIEEAGQ